MTTMTTTLTIADAVTDYLETLGMLRRPRTLESATSILTEFRAAFAERPLTGITRLDLLRYLESLGKAGNSKRTLANKYVRICAMLRHHDVKIMHKGDRPIFTHAIPKVYGPSELDRFLAACDGRQRVFFQTLAMTGLRESEAMWLEWGDLQNGMILLQPHPPNFVPKTHEERRIPVPTTLWKMIFSIERRGRLVFATRTGSPDYHMLRTCKRIAARAGLSAKDWGLHKFRRTYCTNLLRSGMDVRTVMSLMGHSSIQTTLRYLRPIEAEQLRGKMDDIFTYIA